VSEPVAEPRVIDVRRLPQTVFGMRNLATWATIGFMVIEGATLAVAAGSYLYVRHDFAEWPPPPLPPPNVGLPAINVAVILAIIVPMALASRAAHAQNVHGTRVWLLASLVPEAAALALRVADFQALNVNWNANAYASGAWLIVGLHTSLLVVDFVETAVIAALTFSPRMQPKHFTDIEDAAVYQYFLSLVWVPLFVLVYLGPRFL
jgi:heme/copper-type cytochrome/quinol oxidase subunit 3